MFLADYHTHTNYSPDSSCSIKERLQWAVDNNIKELCFTDHVDFFYSDDYSTSFDYNKYIKEIEVEKLAFNDKINIKYGLEIGLSHELTDKANEVVTSKDAILDFVIGSTHAVFKEDLYSNKNFFSGNKIDVYNKYFEQVLLNVQSFDKFDVHGHLDYVYRYNSNPNTELRYIEHKEIIDTILKTLIEKGKGIEINLSGIKYGGKDFYPSFDIVKAYKDLGGEIITIGSDIHEKQSVQQLIIDAQQQLREAGFNYFTTFEKRKPSFIKL